MVFISSACAYVFGLPLGVLVYVTAPGGLCPHRLVYGLLSWVVNVVRSVPFIVLLVFLIPVTRLVVGTSLGVLGAVVPLVFAAIPFVGRVVEQSLAEVDHNLIEAAQSMGASNREIICRVYLREAAPALIRGLPLVAHFTEEQIDRILRQMVEVAEKNAVALAEMAVEETGQQSWMLHPFFCGHAYVCDTFVATVLMKKGRPLVFCGVVCALGHFVEHINANLMTTSCVVACKKCLSDVAGKFWPTDVCAKRHKPCVVVSAGHMSTALI